MDRTGRCAERHNATTTGPARVERELLVEVNGTDKPRDSFIYSNLTKKPGLEPGFRIARKSVRRRCLLGRAGGYRTRI